MIKEQNLLFKRVQFFADLFLVTVSFFIGYFLRDKMLDISPMNFLGTYLRDENLRAISYYAIYIGLLPVLLIIWGGLLHYFGMYKAVGIVKIPAALIIVLKAAVVGFILLGSYVFILRMQEDISRLFIGFVFVSASVLISIEKILLAYIYNILSRTNINFKSSLIVFRRILIVGINKRSMNFIELISKNPDWGINIVGLIDIDAGKKGNPSDKFKVLGYIKDIPEIISNNIIDEVVFIVPRTWLNRIEEAMLYCE
ncbi:MAG: hypothetical protein OEU95_08200, partial [Nitrospirota bacterium]|nr:hypothetical protein [Nitrospirota bacterium]